MTRKATFSGIFLFLFFFTTTYSQPDRIVIPFRVVGKTLVVQGTIDGRRGNLIIDTGFPKMLLNQSEIENADLFTNKEFGGIQSFNGAGQNAGMSVVSLQLQGFSVKIAADVVNLKPIERQKRMNILGILGIDLFRKYELEIDYFAQELRLYRLDKKGARLLQEPQPLPSVTLPFFNQGHLPCITAQLNGMSLQLGLDTGAESNLFSSEVFERSKDQLREVQTKTLLDLNGKRTAAFSAQTSGLQIGALDMPPMAALFIPLNTHYGGLDGNNIHGLLGYEFFRHFRTAINFKKREVYLWDEQAWENGPLATQKN